MAPVKPTFANWKRFADGRQVVTVRFSPEDIYNMNGFFKTHREFIVHLFAKQGVEITRYAHQYVGEVESPMVTEWGLIFTTMEQRIVQTEELYEIHAIIGVNARHTKEIAVGQAADI